MLGAAAPRFMTAVGAGVTATVSIGGPSASSEPAPPDARQVPVYTSSLLMQNDAPLHTSSNQHSDSDWDMCSDEGNVVPLYLGGRGLGQIPSTEEVQHASQQLHDTLRRNLVRQSHMEAARSVLLVDGNMETQSSKQLCATQDPASLDLVSYAGSRMVPSEPNAAREHIVGQALDMFGRDRGVQEAVVSLAQDPAIWQAIQQNEGVRSLLHRRRLSMTAARACESDPDCVPEPSPLGGLECVKKHSNADPVAELLHRMVLELNNVKKTITSLARGIFGGPVEREEEADHGLAQEEEDAVFPALLICTIMVVGIVVFNRPIIVA